MFSDIEKEAIEVAVLNELTLRETQGGSTGSTKDGF